MTPHSLGMLATWMDGRLSGVDSNHQVAGISIDSRSIRAGDLFFALRGEHADGHVYVAAALRAGAACAVVSQDWAREHAADGAALVVVDDPLQALARLGSAFRRQSDIPVIAITGSMGKTTTREMLARVLEQKMSPLVSRANFNTEIGVPLTLAELAPHNDVAVIEMAMRGTGQIRELCEIAKPTCGLITNVGVTHLELLGSREQIAAAKAELLESLPPGAWSVLNADDDFFGYLARRAPGPVTSFGIDRDADYAARAIEIRPDGGSSFVLCAGGEEHAVTLRVPGEFHVANALAAAAAGGLFGIGPEETSAALGQYAGFARRTRLVAADRGWTVFDDTYNASPSAMIGALHTLKAMDAAARKIAVLGDMRELGDYAEEGHRKVGKAVADANPDLLITVGEISEWILDEAARDGYEGRTRHFPSADDAAEWLYQNMTEGDLALVKGSRALEMERIVERLRR